MLSANRLFRNRLFEGILLLLGAMLLVGQIYAQGETGSMPPLARADNGATLPPSGDLLTILAAEAGMSRDEMVLPPNCILYDHGQLFPIQIESQHTAKRVDHQAFAQAILQQTPTADIQVNYVGEWPSEAEAAFEYAAEIWERLISSPQPITIDANYVPLDPGILGAAGPVNYFFNEPGLPVSNRFYPSALANSLAGFDLDPGAADIAMTFSSEFDWYFGTDGNTPNSRYDFASVVLHEIAHGLGFVGAMQVGTLNGQVVGSYTSLRGLPFIYDEFTEDGAGRLLLTVPDFSTELASILRGNNVYFDGNAATRANLGNRPPLYAPATWSRGSSYSHLSEAFRGSENELMVFALARGNPIHYPGSVTLGLLADLGWAVADLPVIDLPDVLIEEGSSQQDVIHLPDFVFDAVDPEGSRYRITGQSGALVTATIDAENNLDIETGSGIGRQTITIEVINGSNFSAADTIEIDVMGELRTLYLPLSAR